MSGTLGLPSALSLHCLGALGGADTFWLSCSCGAARAANGVAGCAKQPQNLVHGRYNLIRQLTADGVCAPQIGSLGEMQPRFEAAQRDVQRLRQEQAELRGSLSTVRPSRSSGSGS